MANLSLVEEFRGALGALNGERHPHVWLDETHGLVAGVFPTPMVQYDFGGDCFRIFEGEQHSSVDVVVEKEEISHLSEAERITNVYEIETPSTIHKVGSAKEAMRVGLEIVEELAPGTLAKLSEVKGRSKRPVARDRDSLYDLRSQRMYSERLRNGYWIATNNKAPEAIGYLRKAIELSGLPEGAVVVRG